MLTHLIIAAHSDAEAICLNWPQAQKWPGLQMAGLNTGLFPALAMAWNDKSQAERLGADALVVTMAGQQGPWVFHLPDDFRDRLAALTPDEFPTLAQAWAQEEELQDFGWTAVDLEALLAKLQEFASRASRERKSLLLWMCF